MSDKPPFTSSELDAALRQEMYRHRSAPSDDASGYWWCVIDDEVWPCQYLVNASITLKLTALIAAFQADAQTISVIGGLNGDPQKGQRR